MKRFFLWILAISSLFSSLQVLAAESPVQKVYRINTYEWNTMDGTYEFLGHGSAVLIGKNKIITNAHVILNEDDVPTGNYSLCISTNFEKGPACVTTLRLLQYDKANDLAILEPIGNISLGEPVEMSDRKLELWETAKVYGYPANGGETITLTEGKVSGLDSGHYKIDANIDAGNSWGGAFDKDGKFIGIPYIASVGYSTLGYIIPVNLIQDFISWKGDVVKYRKVDSKFLKYHNKIKVSIQDQIIDNPYIEFTDFDKKGFTFRSMDEKPNSGISGYGLYSKTEKTVISILIPEIYGKTNIYPATDIDKLRERYGTVIEKKNVTLGGKKINSMLAAIGKKQEDGTVDKNVLYISFSLSNGVNYSIVTDNYASEKKAVNGALSLFIKKLHIKKEVTIIEKTQFNNSAISFNIPSNMNVVKFFGRTGFFFDSNTPQTGTIHTSKSYDDGWKKSIHNFTFEEMMKLYKNSNKTDDVQIEVKQNSLGIYYANVTTKEKNGEKSIATLIYSKIGNYLYSTTISIIMSSEDPELEQKYNQFIETVTSTGTSPFKSVTVWKVIPVGNNNNASSVQ